MNFYNLLNAPVSNWISTSIPIIQTILISMIGLLAVAIIIAVLFQPTNPEQGMNVITGSNDSFYSKHKGSTREGRLNKLIIISSICIFVFTILYFVSFAIYRG